MNTILIIGGLIFYLWVISRRRERGIYLIILLLPAYQIRFRLGPVPLTFLEALILLLAIREGYVLWREGRLKTVLYEQVIRPGRRNLPIIFFLLAALVSVSVSPVTAKAAGIFKAYFFEAILFYFLVLLIIDDAKKLAGVWKSLAFLIIYLSGFGLYQFITLANLPFSWWAVNVASRRITSLLNHPNALALLVGPILAMFLILLLTSRTWAKNKLLIISVVLGLAALYLSFSRAAWLALIIILLAFTPFISLPGPVARARSKLWSKVLLPLLIVVLIVLLIPFSRMKLLELASRTDPSLQNRYVLWNATRDMLKQNPIYGVGLMGFHEAYKDYPLGPDKVVQNYPHNFFLNFWVEIGLVGLLAMLGLLYIFQKKIRYLLATPWRPIALAAAAGMSVVVLHGLVDVSYFKNDLSVLFWLIYAIPNLPFLSYRT